MRWVQCIANAGCSTACGSRAASTDQKGKAGTVGNLDTCYNLQQIKLSSAERRNDCVTTRPQGCRNSQSPRCHQA